MSHFQNGLHFIGNVHTIIFICDADICNNCLKDQYFQSCMKRSCEGFNFLYLNIDKFVCLI